MNRTRAHTNTDGCHGQAPITIFGKEMAISEPPANLTWKMRKEANNDNNASREEASDALDIKMKTEFDDGK